MTIPKQTYTIGQRICDDLRFLSKRYRKRLALTNHEAAVRLHYQHICKQFLPLEEPSTMPEYIQWLKLYGCDKSWTTLSDKYLVREYVAKCGLSQHLNQLYAVCDQPEEIPWEDLPDTFALKPNNGCHCNVLVHDKAHANKEAIIKQLRQSMATPFGLTTAEFHYLNIRPKILVEKLLLQPDSPHGLIDYKIYCTSGEPRAILICIPTQSKRPFKAILDTSWRVVPAYNTHDVNLENLPQRPECLDELLNAAKTLATPYSFIRIDYYIINNKPIFGEMTFTPAGGYRPYGSALFMQDMGHFISEAILP